MASLLAKFRIAYSDLQIVPDITKPASETSQSFFDSLIADFRSKSDGSVSDEDGRRKYTFAIDSEKLIERCY